MKPVTIKKRSDFLLAASAGKKFITNSIILQMIKREPSHPAGQVDVRVGYTVTKKMGGAVVRNRVKRRLREAARPLLLKFGAPGHDYVIISRNKAVGCEYLELARDMEFAFSRIIHHKNTTQKPTAETTQPGSKK